MANKMNTLIGYAVISACVNCTLGCCCCSIKDEGGPDRRDPSKEKPVSRYFEFHLLGASEQKNLQVCMTNAYFNGSWGQPIQLKSNGCTNSAGRLTIKNGTWVIEDKDGKPFTRKGFVNTNLNQWVIVKVTVKDCTIYLYIDNITLKGLSKGFFFGRNYYSSPFKDDSVENQGWSYEVVATNVPNARAYLGVGESLALNDFDSRLAKRLGKK